MVEDALQSDAAALVRRDVEELVAERIKNKALSAGRGDGDGGAPLFRLKLR